MTQPVFAFPCEYGFTAERSSYSQAIKLSATASGATPSNALQGTTSYEIRTVPIDNDLAVSLDNSLQSLNGSFFSSQFYFDNQQFKYRIIDDTWQWEVIGPTANVFTLRVERVYEPTIEFAIDYGLTQSQVISTVLLRLATSSGTATPSAQSRSIKEVQVKTRPMSYASAVALEASLLALNGGSFYSQMSLDATPRLYRLSPYQWQWTPESEDAYVADFTVIEVMSNTTDIPCRETIGIERRSRIRKAQFGDGYEQVAPDGINTEIVVYSIETLPLSDTQAASLNTTLLSRKGDFFFSKLKDEPAVAKYRLDDNRWSWNIEGKDANVFQFSLRKVYDL